MKKTTIILFWYFMIAGSLTQPSVTEGPFDSKAQCDQLRDWAIKNPAAIDVASQCWEVKSESH
jgi:hypothetical protein